MSNGSVPIDVSRRSPAAVAAAGTSVGYFRWVICGLLFFAATINYIDRQVIGILKPTLQQQFGWSEIDYSDIVFAFQGAYAIGFLLAGRMIDKLGARTGFAIAIIVWSLAAIAHAEAPVFGVPVAHVFALVGLTYSASVAGFIVARMALGLGEAGNFPAAIKVVAEWFPKRERALAELPDKIDALQAEIADLHRALADPDLYRRDPVSFAARTARLDTAQGELEAAETEWLELEMLREELQARS